MSRTDSGESTAAINRRAQQRSADVVFERLARGGVLTRDAATRLYYVDGGGGLTPATVMRLYAERKIVPGRGGYVLPGGA